MSRTYKHYLNDILTATAKVHRYTHGLDFEAFEADEMCVDSVLHNLMIVGEAVKSIPDEVQQQHPDVRWRDISRFRDRMVHHYFRVDLKVIWEIVQIHLPVLRRHVERLLEQLEEDDTNGNE